MATRRKTGEHYVDENGNYRLGGQSTPSVSTPKVTPTVDISNNPFTPESLSLAPKVTQAASAPAPTQTYSKKVTETYTPVERDTYQRGDFGISPETRRYRSLLRDTESDRPAAFNSRYEGAIQSILDNILNRKPFDIQSDANYQMLYDQAKQSALSAGNRAMRDTMGAAAGLTGGYGSTAATSAAQQAYDQHLESLNDRNLQLMQMAYQMYGDETADRYNQLAATEGLDQTDYSRHRDDVNDWENDRAYYANQYQNSYGRDWNEYEYGENMDYDIWKYAQNLDYQLQRDEETDYQNALSNAMTLAKSGFTVPARYAGRFDEATLAQLGNLAAQAVAARSAGGGGRSRNTSGGNASGGSTSSAGQDSNGDGRIDLVDVMNLARNTGASKAELEEIYNDMTEDEKERYNLQLRH